MTQRRERIIVVGCRTVVGASAADFARRCTVVLGAALEQRTRASTLFGSAKRRAITILPDAEFSTRPTTTRNAHYCESALNTTHEPYAHSVIGGKRMNSYVTIITNTQTHEIKGSKEIMHLN